MQTGKLKKNYCENVILYFNTIILQCVVILLLYNTHCSALTLACSITIINSCDE